MPVLSPSGYRSKSKTRFGRSKVLESVQPSYANTKIAIRVLSTQLDLLCYECRINIASKSNFRFERYDILSSPKERFNVIRATNVLNLVYFLREKLTKAIAHVIASLDEGGLFTTGSNLEARTIVNGGIYKKCAAWKRSKYQAAARKLTNL